MTITIVLIALVMGAAAALTPGKRLNLKKSDEEKVLAEKFTEKNNTAVEKRTHIEAT
jgi:hypothetical protein